MASQPNVSIPPPVTSELEFCPWCGSILPLMSLSSPFVKCERCQFVRSVREYNQVVEEFTIYFNHPKKKKDLEVDSQTSKQSISIGPTVDRQCPQCKSEVMTYTTRQTRSADEGQTVFYTCIQCKFQDIEYS